MFQKRNSSIVLQQAVSKTMQVRVPGSMTRDNSPLQALPPRTQHKVREFVMDLGSYKPLKPKKTDLSNHIESSADEIVYIKQGTACKGKKVRPKTWTAKEDQTLLHLYSKYPDNWVKIAAEIKTKDKNECKTRYQKLKKSKVGAWSQEEVKQLQDLYK